MVRLSGTLAPAASSMVSERNTRAPVPPIAKTKSFIVWSFQFSVFSLEWLTQDRFAH
jgi:hypothetical protein